MRAEISRVATLRSLEWRGAERESLIVTRICWWTPSAEYTKCLEPHPFALGCVTRRSRRLCSSEPHEPPNLNLIFPSCNPESSLPSPSPQFFPPWIVLVNLVSRLFHLASHAAPAAGLAPFRCFLPDRDLAGRPRLHSLEPHQSCPS